MNKEQEEKERFEKWYESSCIESRRGCDSERVWPTMDEATGHYNR